MNEETTVVTAPMEGSLADALTKEVESETLQYHVQGEGAEIRQDRHEMAPKTEDEKSEVEYSGELEDCCHGGDARRIRGIILHNVSRHNC